MVTDNRGRKVKAKKSKRYHDRGFDYWWDISPELAQYLDQYHAVEFLKKDTGERCSMPPEAIRGFLTGDRITPRDGNWTVKVLPGHPGELAFEPGPGGGDWLFLPVVWVEPDSK